MGIYQEFGITPIINASGAVTRLGGTPMNPETLAAFAEAARASVPLEQLQASTSRIIAEADLVPRCSLRFNFRIRNNPEFNRI